MGNKEYEEKMKTLQTQYVDMMDHHQYHSAIVDDYENRANEIRSQIEELKEKKPKTLKEVNEIPESGEFTIVSVGSCGNIITNAYENEKGVLYESVPYGGTGFTQKIKRANIEDCSLNDVSMKIFIVE